jgi:hypothetical protein
MKFKTEKLAIIKDLINTHDFDFERDVFQLSYKQKSILYSMSKQVNYRRSRNRYLTTGSCFYVHLQNLYNKGLKK